MDRTDRGERSLAPLTGAQVDEAGQMLAGAFFGDPAAAFLFPDRSRRLSALAEVWRGALRYSLRYGEAWTAPELDGVACWLPPGHVHKSLPRMLRAGMWRFFFRLRPSEVAANLANDRYARQLHARYAPHPHWYLFVIGVRPGCKGQGTGNALLRPMLARCDDEGLPAYLETHNPRNLRFYERNGFAVAGEGRIPGSEVAVFAMLRPPHAGFAH